MKKKYKKADLYEIVLYSLEDKVQSLATSLTLEESKIFMEEYKALPNQMIGLIPQKKKKFYGKI